MNSSMWGGLFESRRFWAAIAGLVVVVVQATQLKDYLTEEMVNNIVMLIASWIVGDSLEKTLPASLKFSRFMRSAPGDSGE